MQIEKGSSILMKWKNDIFFYLKIDPPERIGAKNVDSELILSAVTDENPLSTVNIISFTHVLFSISEQETTRTITIILLK